MGPAADAGRPRCRACHDILSSLYVVAFVNALGVHRADIRLRGRIAMELIGFLFICFAAVLTVAYMTNRVREPPKPRAQVIRYDPPPVDRQWRQLCSWIQNVMGEQYHREALTAWAAAGDRALELVREPHNERDRHAIAVFGVWDGGAARGLLGYLPRELAAEIASSRPADLPLRASPYSLYVRGEFVDLKIRILEPSARSEYWKSLGGAPPQLATTHGRTA